MKKYEKKLLIYIRRISNFAIEEAEDILQDVFIKVYRNLNNFDQSLKFSSWIYRITRNEVISRFRKSKARPQTIANQSDKNIFDFIRADIDLELEIDHQKNRERIEHVLNQLDIKYREIIILKYFEEQSYQEISDIIKKPVGTVATYLNRAKKQFKKLYIKQYDK